MLRSAVWAAILAVSFAANAAANAPLLGRWEQQAGTGGWLGFEWIEFDSHTVRTDLFEAAFVDRYEIDGNLLRVHMRFGETYVFELIDGSTLCLPEATLHALREPDAASAGADRLCYVRV